MKKIFFLFTVVSILTFFNTIQAGAQSNFSTIGDSYKEIGVIAGEAGYGEAVDPRLIISRIIKLILTFVATILFALNVYAGYNWMTAGGNEEKVAKAKDIIRNSTIGLIVVLSAYGITIAATNLALGRDVGSNAGSGSSLDDAVQQWMTGD